MTPSSVIRWMLLVATAVVVAACTKGNSSSSEQAVAAPTSASQPSPFKIIKGLSVHGYNYTNTAIGLYSVAGVGGGNIDVSTETTGGSKTTCCASMPNQLPPGYTINVRWTRDGESWCELQVPFNGPVPDDAYRLMTHFYPDGHVEIEVGGDADIAPRLRMPHIHGNKRYADDALNVNRDDRFATCRRGR